MAFNGSAQRALLVLAAIGLLTGCQATEGKFSERPYLFTVINDDSLTVSKIKEKNIETLFGNAEKKADAKGKPAKKKPLTVKASTSTKKGSRVTKEVKVASVSKSRSDKRPYANLIAAHAAANNVPLGLAHAVVKVESSYNHRARGAVGEIGLMQLRLGTARMVGYRGSAKGLYDPATNIKYGMRYLGKARSLAGGNTCGTILRYNAGHGAKRMNPISARYCAKVKRLLR